MEQPHLVLLYQFFHPDEVISARLFSDLAQAMSERGWQVTAMPAARLFDSKQPLAKSDNWQNVSIRRVWRPAFQQSSNRGRILNALFMLWAWSWRALLFRRHRHEVVVIGTDPVLSVMIAIAWRLFRPGSKIVHWCHDLHPEASLAEGSLRSTSLAVRILRRVLRHAYRRCDVIVDLGSCMRRLLQQDVGDRDDSQMTYCTITPWALVEPTAVGRPDSDVRHELFGSCKLACLYSGNLGRAHEFDLFVQLARRTNSEGVSFCFAGRGARMSELKAVASQAAVDIRFADFASESQLNLRLEAGDVHLVSLKDSWTGTVVPSKFFGALAIGRPVLFLGSSQCALAQWIVQYNVGWHLTAANVEEVACQLRELARHPEQLRELNEHCQQIYRQEFSKQHLLDRWQALLSSVDPV